MYVAADKSENVPVPLQHGQVWEPFGRTATSKARGVFFFSFWAGIRLFYHPRLREIGHIRAVWNGYSQGDKTPNAKTRTPVHLRTAQEPEPATYIPDYNNTFRVQY